MRRGLSLLAAAAFGLSLLPAGAQTTVTIEPQVRTQVREYAVKQKRPSVKVAEEIRVGARLPQSVQFYEIEGIPAASGYRYAYVNDRYVLVDPAERTIVYMYD